MCIYLCVIGIKSQKIRQALLQEQDSDLETAEKFIQLAERLEEDVLHFDNPINHTNYTVAKLHRNQPKCRKQTGLGQLLAGQLLGGHLRPDICSLGHLLARTFAR